MIDLITVYAFTAMYAIVSFLTGILSMTFKYDNTLSPFQDNSRRFVGAIWFSASFGFTYCAFNIQPENSSLFYFLLGCIVVGGFVRLISLKNYPASLIIIGSVLLEWIPPILMVRSWNNLTM